MTEGFIYVHHQLKFERSSHVHISGIRLHKNYDCRSMIYQWIFVYAQPSNDSTPHRQWDPFDIFTRSYLTELQCFMSGNMLCHCHCCCRCVLIFCWMHEISTATWQAMSFCRWCEHFAHSTENTHFWHSTWSFGCKYNDRFVFLSNYLRKLNNSTARIDVNSLQNYGWKSFWFIKIETENNILMNM